MRADEERAKDVVWAIDRIQRYVSSRDAFMGDELVQIDLGHRRRRHRGALDRVRDLRELAIPPGNRLERLSGDRRGHHSIRINQQYRICFRWEAGYAYEVEVADYH